MNNLKNDKYFWIMVVLSVMETVGMVIALATSGIAIMGYYTQESNLLMLIAALTYIIFRLTHREETIPSWIIKFQYVGACALTVTFVTVILVLIPMYAPAGIGTVFWMLLGASNWVHHLLGPIISVVAVLIFEKSMRPTVKDALMAAVPTLLYAIVFVILNAFRVVHGPYPFLYVHEQPVWMSVMWFILIPGGGFLFALLFGKIKNKVVNKNNVQ